MTWRIAAALLAALLAIPSGQLRAEFVLFGNGQSSCGEYVAAADGERYARGADTDPNLIYTSAYLKFVAWADGYLSGANKWDAAATRAGAKSDHAGRQAWLSIYCRNNPLQPYAIALAALRAELQTLQP
ncbi:hypothetical protein [Limobrevibacterium gyesilva]|uniref:Uncharacterized protein n=1 Tax=Limobrevibacterium gyesilva TaxID=2991712 RepID=A0AA42CEL0_9PROT|nr:hypothetical protein [Limobrevibacterium gyesilva]MCW3476178.1 hypothetical protein [Limobrevibacterium gyesilva]